MGDLFKIELRALPDRPYTTDQAHAMIGNTHEVIKQTQLGSQLVQQRVTGNVVKAQVVPGGHAIFLTIEADIPVIQQSSPGYVNTGGFPRTEFEPGTL
jgi:hypothetical protein